MSAFPTLFASDSDQWPTPQWLFDELDDLFGFTLDVCASATDAKCATYYDVAADGLTQPWTGTCWMNPPYGRDIARWMAKAAESAKQGATVVCLIPARTDTQWWHEHVVGADEVWFVQGRLRFGERGDNAPFPSAIVIYRPGSSGAPRLKLWTPSRRPTRAYRRRVSASAGSRAA